MDRLDLVMLAMLCEIVAGALCAFDAMFGGDHKWDVAPSVLLALSFAIMGVGIAWVAAW